MCLAFGRRIHCLDGHYLKEMIMLIMLLPYHKIYILILILILGNFVQLCAILTKCAFFVLLFQNLILPIFVLPISALPSFVPSYICHFLYLFFLFLRFLFLFLPIFVTSYICSSYIWCFLCLCSYKWFFLYFLIPGIIPSCEMGCHRKNWQIGSKPPSAI